MLKIGILTCSQATQTLGCCSSSCLSDLHRRSGLFSRYAADKIELVGIAGCPMCPTSGSSERLLREVRTLADAGAAVIHVSSCIMMLCAFKDKQFKSLQEKFSRINFVMGTHELRIDSDEFWDKVKSFSTVPMRQPVARLIQSPQGITLNET